MGTNSNKKFSSFLPSSRFDILSLFDIAPIDFAIKCFSNPLSNCFIEENYFQEEFQVFQVWRYPRNRELESEQIRVSTPDQHQVCQNLRSQPGDKTKRTPI